MIEKKRTPLAEKLPEQLALQRVLAMGGSSSKRAERKYAPQASGCLRMLLGSVCAADDVEIGRREFEK